MSGTQGFNKNIGYGFNNQANVPWGNTFRPSTRRPLVSNTLFDTYDNALSLINDRDKPGESTASSYPGMIFSVIKDADDKNGVYVVKQIKGVDTTTGDEISVDDDPKETIIEKLDAGKGFLLSTTIDKTLITKAKLEEWGSDQTNLSNFVSNHEGCGIYLYDNDTTTTDNCLLYYIPTKEDNGEWELTQIGGGGGIKNITYSNLKSLKDSNKLKPGLKYRITDYVTTTSKADTKSAGHLFDLIVTAISKNELSCKAYASKSDRDTDKYFEKCDLNKWEIWYDINNDATKYEWADATSGTGVIYRMIDEFNNDVPYDFKNIQFKRWKLLGYKLTLSDSSNRYLRNSSSPYKWSKSLSEDSDILYTNTLDKTTLYTDSNLTTQSSLSISSVEELILNNKYLAYSENNNLGNGYSVDSTLSVGSYTFNYSDSEEKDQSVECCNNNKNFCFNNKISSRFDNRGTQKQFLNNICFVYCLYGSSCTNNTFGNFCYDMSFQNSCVSNTFGNYCYSNIFGDYCNSNIFENSCYHNIFVSGCYRNIFGSYCNSNTFGSDCGSNTFGNSCSSNTFGSFCNSNTFGNSCSSNTFGSFCNSNTFGNSCTNNTFGNSCSSNTFGNSCSSNTFGNYCSSNTFGNTCYLNIFGAGIRYSTTWYGGISPTLLDYVRNVTLGDECVLINIEVKPDSGSPSNTNWIQNIKVSNGTQVPYEIAKDNFYTNFKSNSGIGIIYVANEKLVETYTTIHINRNNQFETKVGIDENINTVNGTTTHTYELVQWCDSNFTNDSDAEDLFK